VTSTAALAEMPASAQAATEASAAAASTTHQFAALLPLTDRLTIQN